MDDLWSVDVGVVIFGILDSLFQFTVRTIQITTVHRPICDELFSHILDFSGHHVDCRFFPRCQFRRSISIGRFRCETDSVLCEAMQFLTHLG
ncbi:hypothetical protein C454_18349 [Haloferax gibbonsii ATCC 33959]|uniref:Uncharacterized protein n=1 Tax=Haloferax gibbonsii (strain ATCC 33959 / DSM 4427 / JCM 8863 / NBRC 102184 / NCIMB 2188 / Ma 2.38) TaxID=1227459 RepID=M0GVN2_HALGM|nr:hypothetical protein C454_18349 [Haloferax gibbonsii ATCC 33959]